MEKITPAEAWSFLLAAALAFTTLASAAEKIVKAWKAAKAPSDRQNERLDKLERRLDEVDKKLTNDNDRFACMDEGSRVTQRAILALLDHGIDGNNIEQMQDAKKALQDHLINR